MASIDTPTTGSLTRENISAAVLRDLTEAGPSSCRTHPEARIESLFMDRGRVELVTFDCGCRKPVTRPGESRSAHSFRD